MSINRYQRDLSKLRRFEFEVVTVNPRGEIIQRENKAANYFVEMLSAEVGLEMVEIPSGSFVMGSPEDEAERSSYEGPQHQVSVERFLMGKYPVTQAQWRVVANWEKIELDLNPEPSRFTGEKLPVEKISWHEAQEFCARLAKRIGKDYRLPSEAEWEYACRAGTTTPFHFGETLTTDLANYDGKYTYGNGPSGEYQEKTTPPGSFPANAFGLYDMHGTVWEWCADPWHRNYIAAPNDGSAWTTNADSRSHVVRGGSWFSDPRHCRSAYRDDLDYVFLNLGFRVVCVPPRT